MLYEFTDRYGQSWAIEMPEGGVGVLRSPLNPEQPITAADALGSEVIRLVERVMDLEHNLVLAGEARENTETRLSGRIAELTEEVRDLRAVLKTIFALNPEMGEAEVARLQARGEALRDRVREEMEKNASIRADLVSLRIDLSVAVKDGQRLEEERRVLRDRVTTLEQEGAHLEAENAKLLNDLRAITTEIHGSLTAENIRLEDENGKLRTSKAIYQNEIGFLSRDLREAIKTGEELRAGIAAELNEKRGCLKDNERLRTDLAAAIRTGEELNARMAKQDLAFDNQRMRLFRLDALLSSEEPPEGLCELVGFDRYGDRWPADDAWRWFRGQLGAPADKEG